MIFSTTVSVNSSGVDFSHSAISLVPAGSGNPGPGHTLHVDNVGANSAFFGPSDGSLTSGNGFEVAPGESWTFVVPAGDHLSAITSSGLTTSLRTLGFVF